MNKKKGYLLVDLSLALFLIGLLFLGVNKNFKMYLKTNNYIKENYEVLDAMTSLSMEIKNNLTFEDIRSFKEDSYVLRDFELENLIRKDIKDFLLENLILSKEENSLGFNIYIKHLDDYESNIKISYKSIKPYIKEEVEVKIYKFLIR